MLLNNRKFTLALFASIIGTLALFTSFLTGSEYVTLQSIILGLYGASNVAQKATHKEKP